MSELVRGLGGIHISSPPAENADRKSFMDEGGDDSEFEDSVSQPVEEDEDDDSGSDASSSSYETADEGEWLYLKGDVPSRDDLHAYEALKDTKIDSSSFPLVWSWQQTVAAATEAERRAWGRADKDSWRRRKDIVAVPKLAFEDD